MKLLLFTFMIGAVYWTEGCGYPNWPQDFKWSYAGAIDGMVCTRIFEPKDPHTWTDNFFCHKSAHGMQGLGMVWSHQG